MTINLNVNSNMQNYYVNNTNTDADGGGSVMPSHEAGANGYTYGDAVEISLSANAQSYNAEQVPNGERPPVGETVVVWGRVRETSAGGASSFSGWAETNGGDNSEYHYYGDVTAEETPPETQLIDNKAVERPSHKYTDRLGHTHQVVNKSDMLRVANTFKQTLERGNKLTAAMMAATIAKNPELGIAVGAAFIASPWGRTFAALDATAVFAIDEYIQYVEKQPDNWEVDVIVDDGYEGNDDAQPWNPTFNTGQGNI